MLIVVLGLIKLQSTPTLAMGGALRGSLGDVSEKKRYVNEVACRTD